MASTLAAPALAQTTRKVSGRMASSFPPSLVAINGLTVFFKRTVAEPADGAFTIQGFGWGELVPAFSVLDAVQAGTAENGQTAALSFVGKDPTFALASGLPFGMSARGHHARLEMGGNDLLDVFFTSCTVKAVTMGNTRWPRPPR